MTLRKLLLIASANIFGWLPPLPYVRLERVPLPDSVKRERAEFEEFQRKVNRWIMENKKERRRWTPDEERQLKEEVEQNMTLVEIAKRHDRTVKAVETMARLHGFRGLHSGQCERYRRKLTRGN